jgi:hypothetical protein
MSEKKVIRCFLGGTCNNSTWRERLIPLLTIDYFNPVVKDWTEECQAEELRQREECDFCLYVITPKMTGFYSIAEVVDDSNKRPKKTIFCFTEEDEIGDYVQIFTTPQIKSLKATQDLIHRNGGYCCTCLESVASYLNGKVNG